MFLALWRQKYVRDCHRVVMQEDGHTTRQELCLALLLL